MDGHFMARAGAALAIFLAASSAFAQVPSSQVSPGLLPSPIWVPPSASPALPARPAYRMGGIEDPAFIAVLQGIYDSSAAIMGKRFTQFSSDAKSLQASHAMVLNALVATQSPDALVNCVRAHQASDNTDLAGSLRKDVEQAQANLVRQQQAVVGALRIAYPFDLYRAQAFDAQYAALALNSAVTAQTLIRANTLQ
jgi:hypothetical protein